MNLMCFDVCHALKRGLEGFILSRRAVLTVIICLSLILYVGPDILYWIISKTEKAKMREIPGSTAKCVEDHLGKYLKSDKSDYTVIKSYENGKKNYLPYVGNGKLGIFVNENLLYIRHNRSLSLSLDYHPLVDIYLPGETREDSVASDFRRGIGYKIQCFHKNHGMVSVTNQIIAHRVYPSVLVQMIEIINLSDDLVTLALKQNLPEMPLRTLNSGKKGPRSFHYHKFNADVTIPETQFVIFVSALSVFAPTEISIEPKSSKSLSVRTAIHYSNPLHPIEYAFVKKKVQETTQKEFFQALEMSVHSLKRQHEDVWEKLWQSGFSISISRAQNALNGDKINATLYYVLSNVRDYLSEVDVSQSHLSAFQRYLYSPDKCYSGHNTLQASKLWSDFSFTYEVNNVVSLWLLTLNKQGCHNLINSGARGALQAMILSFGGFKFSNNHLEFDCDPKDLHRDFHFRRIMYGNSTLINISVIIQEDNKALIYASLDKSDKDYFGCDGGCLASPVLLTSNPSQFSVKITNPLTSILYITPDKSHLEELKHAIHVQGVIEAPAHGHHIIALHRHGHQLGGLPVIFWISVAFLITVFHLFLAKLIYNEYCGIDEKRKKKSFV